MIQDEFLNLVISSLKPYNNNNLSILKETNRKSLSEFVSYLSKLKKEAIVDDKQFSELIVLAFANFIENEIETRISKSISDRVIHIF